MRAWLLPLVGLLALAAPAMAQPALRGFGAEGGDFRATLSDGRILRGADLIGATLHILADGQPLALRIEAAAPDARQPDLWLFTLTLTGPDGARQAYCLPDPEGHSLAIPYPDPTEPLGFGLTCSAGAAGKCMRAGYRPWALAPDGVTPLAPYHAACVNMFRGAYGGGERAWTRDGMSIDIYDRIGIERPGNETDQAFEAGWTPEGTVCLAHPRVPGNGSLAEIAAAVPRLQGRTGAEACTEASAAAWGALVFNRSRPPGG